ncbi:MAG TPA: bifunctional glycosyltransferase/class I SAM-dependent methyltransferase [Polyangiaceae bacterium]|nr:bifunctional glycosyltransferase/class I SAM-dependent methyltransferase [Polyangiaceae bacterium]
MPVAERPRLLIFIIAYYAESTLRWVLDRVPSSLFEDFDCEILVIDDASKDRTYEVGSKYQREHASVRMTVLRNEYNQGYGGNQKLGYAYALSHDFDFVALVHGDGQYAPEELPRLLAPLRSGEADAVFGSRMLERGQALKGGMPLYKYVGNRILTTVQNLLLGSQLSEFHSGYRIYSVSALTRIPFRLNSNDFHFDTEIIIQLMNAGARIVELPIPTYYGDEICHVNGMKYAKDVIWATLQNLAHRSGFGYQRRFEPKHEGNIHYDLKLGYASSHSYALAAVPPGSRVLDVGSGPGGLAGELLKKGCQVTLVDQFPAQVDGGDVQVVVQNLDEDLAFDAGDQDVLLLLDVIEHLRDPERFLEQLRCQFAYEPKRVILTTPNVAFIITRVMLALGQFNYGKAGILDRTHTRLFTFGTLRRLLSDEGFRIKELRGVPAPLPKVLGNGLLGKAALGVNLALIRFSRTLFSYQIYVEAESTPDVSFVLADSKRRGSTRPPPAADSPRSGPAPSH